MVIVLECAEEAETNRYHSKPGKSIGNGLRRRKGGRDEEGQRTPENLPAQGLDCEGAPKRKQARSGT